MSPSPLTFSEGIGTSSLSWKLSMTSKDYFLKTILKQEFFNGERKQKIIFWFLLLFLLSPVKKRFACIFLQVYCLFLLVTKLSFSFNCMVFN